MNDKHVPKLIGGIGPINFGKQWRQGNRVYDVDSIAMCLTAQPLGNAGGYSYLYTDGGIKGGENVENVRIRKLTPTECYKLMGFDAEDCQKCSEGGISNSQLYKQAGNSIVVNVLEAIFSKLGETYEEFTSR